MQGFFTFSVQNTDSLKDRGKLEKIPDEPAEFSSEYPEYLETTPYERETYRRDRAQEERRKYIVEVLMGYKGG